MHHIKSQKTKILATVGPACNTYEKLVELAEAGVDGFRLNFSHGRHEDHLKVIEHIQRLNREHGFNVSMLGDLQGPKLRVGVMENDGLPIKPGDILTFVNEKCIGNKDRIYMSYPQFAADVKVGEKVLLDDGKLEMRVVSTNGVDTVKLEVLFGSMLSSKKGVNLPDTKVSLPCLTEKDLEDLEFMMQYPFNWIALSFVRNASDMTDLRTRLQAAGHKAKIMAKIEKPEAIQNIAEIIEATDAVMVARGDLGVEMPLEQLPTLQKDIVRRCNNAHKPVVVATQMMDSMTFAPSPTRAEVSDVANAVTDGADCVMLSGETSTGAHPKLVVEYMNRIIAQAETNERMFYRKNEPKAGSPNFLSDVVCYNASEIAREIGAKAIVGMTKSGYTGYVVSSFRPKADIYIFSSDDALLGTLNLVWGTRCFHYDRFSSTDETIADVQRILLEQGLVNIGDTVINIGSMPLHERKRTNMLKISRVD